MANLESGEKKFNTSCGLSTKKELDKKVSLCADDLLIYVTNPFESIPNMMFILKVYGKGSCYKLNLAKKCAIFTLSWNDFLVDFGMTTKDFTAFISQLSALIWDIIK